MNYVHKLQEKMKEQGMDEEYIKLCSEYAQNLCDNNVPVIFDFKHLSLLLGYETAELAFYLFAEDNWFYKEIQIPKKRGGFRIIDIPSDRLKEIQSWILKNILNKIDENCFKNLYFHKDISSMLFEGLAYRGIVYLLKERIERDEKI